MLKMQNRSILPFSGIMSYLMVAVFVWFSGISLQAQSQIPEAVTAFNEAMAHFNAKAYEKAIISYSKAIELDPAYTKA